MKWKIYPILLFRYFKIFLFLGKNYSFYKLLKMSLYYIGIRLQHSLKISKLLFYPPNLYLFCTQKCNLTCGFCHYTGTLLPANSSEDDMTLENLKKIMSVDKVVSPSRVCFYGGEPFVNENLFEMIDYSFEQGFLPSVITNGILIPKHFDKIINSKLLFMTLSFYPEVTWRLENYVKMLAERMIVNISFIITDHRLDLFEKVIKFAIDTGAHMITIENLIEKDSFDESALFDDAEYRMMKSRLLNKYNKKIIFRWSSVQTEVTDTKIRCPDFWDMLLVDKDGKILPCCQFPLSEFGDNLYDKDGFNSPKMVDLRDKMLRDEVPTLCEGCHFLHAKDPLYRFGSEK